jgi:hypothetical protein
VDDLTYFKRKQLEVSAILERIHQEADAVSVRAQALELKAGRVARFVPDRERKLQRLLNELRAIHARMDEMLSLTLGEMKHGRPVIDEPAEPENEIQLADVQAPAREHDF